MAKVNAAMLIIRDAIVDASAKPASEWINGRAFARFVNAWAKTAEQKRGKVGPEWRFVAPLDSYRTESVVPDVAYPATYFDRKKSDRTYPNVSPYIGVEILSPDDKPRDVADKRAFSLAWGVKLVVIAAPVKRPVDAHDSTQSTIHYLQYDVLTSGAFPR